MRWQKPCIIALIGFISKLYTPSKRLGIMKNASTSWNISGTILFSETIAYNFMNWWRHSLLKHCYYSNIMYYLGAAAPNLCNGFCKQKRTIYLFQFQSIRVPLLFHSAKLCLIQYSSSPARFTEAIYGMNCILVYHSKTVLTCAITTTFN